MAISELQWFHVCSCFVAAILLTFLLFILMCVCVCARTCAHAWACLCICVCMCTWVHVVSEARGVETLWSCSCRWWELSKVGSRNGSHLQEQNKSYALLANNPSLQLSDGILLFETGLQVVHAWIRICFIAEYDFELFILMPLLSKFWACRPASPWLDVLSVILQGCGSNYE